MSGIEIKRNPPSLRERTVVRIYSAIDPSFEGYAKIAADRAAAAIRALPLGTFYDEEPLPPSVRPAENADRDSHHWIGRGGTHTVGRWCGDSVGWLLIGNGTSISPERMHELGYTYHSPLDPPGARPK